MKTAAVAIRQLLGRVGAWFGVEGAWLVVGAVFLSIWAYQTVSPSAPWAVLGGLCVIAWWALTTRRT